MRSNALIETTKWLCVCVCGNENEWKTKSSQIKTSRTPKPMCVSTPIKQSRRSNQRIQREWKQFFCALCSLFLFFFFIFNSLHSTRCTLLNITRNLVDIWFRIIISFSLVFFLFGWRELQTNQAHSENHRR